MSKAAAAMSKASEASFAKPTAGEIPVGVLVRLSEDELEVVREIVLREAAKAKQQGRMDRWEFLGGVIDGFNRGLHPEGYGC